MPSPGSADALLFDLGRVVLSVDVGQTMATWARHALRHPDDISSRFKIDKACLNFELGRIDEVAYFASLRSLLGVDLTDAQWREGWNAMLTGEMPGIGHLLERAARKLPLYALSNTNAVHEAHFMAQHAATLSHFKAIFASSSIGLLKPNPAAYAHVVKAMGVRANRIVFFDDLIENVEAARDAGMIAVQVVSPETVGEALAAMRII